MNLLPTPSDPPLGLALTGERTLPGIPDERYWFQRHVVAYEQAARDIDGMVVLDAGCGEGYGLALLRERGAAEAIGVDLEAAVVDHITRTYTEADAAAWAIEAELADLPLPPGLFDRTVSFQVIEHVWDVPAYLAELRRVTRPGAQVWIATPNRLTFTPDSPTPVNPFHVTEFTADELRTALAAAGFTDVLVTGVHHGPELAAAEAALGHPLTATLTAGPPASWPKDIRDLVHRSEAGWFEVRDDDLDASLDLIAVCQVPS